MIINIRCGDTVQKLNLSHVMYIDKSPTDKTKAIIYMRDNFKVNCGISLVELTKQIDDEMLRIHTVENNRYWENYFS